MANSLVQFRVDESMRIQAVDICERLGIDLPTAMRMFLFRMVQENGIPFSMTLDDDGKTARALTAMKKASLISAENGNADMSLDDINAEIAAARK